MDAPFSAAGIVESLEALIGSGDFDGAEELLFHAMEKAPKLEAFFHFQFSRLYVKWNKLTSAQNHVLRAIDLSHEDELFKIQLVSELKSIKARQAEQCP